ncbi:MFS transporter [Clostridiaceae bacterium M8S5]|nr:MFS transporter [Clostridiaceae bacterium M8S5]
MKNTACIAILSISFLIIITGALVSPALGSIKEYFPLASTYNIKLLVTLPSMLIIPASLASGKLSSKINKKKLVVIGLILYIIGGACGAFVSTLSQLLLVRGIIGVGMGILLPLIGSLISDIYKGKAKVKMLGYSNASSNLGGILGTYFSGKLALIGWRYIFLLYLVAVISFTLVIIWLPSSDIVLKKKKASSSYMNKEVIRVSVIAIFTNIAFYSVMTNIALFLINENLGRADSAGLSISFLTLAGFLSGLLLHRLTALMKKMSISVPLFLMSIGFVIISRATTFTGIIVSVVMIGFSMGILTPVFQLKVIEVTPKNNNTFALSFLNGSIYFGKFASPIVLTLIASLFGWDSQRVVFLFVSIMVLAIALVDILYQSEFFKSFKKNRLYNKRIYKSL